MFPINDVEQNRYTSLPFMTIAIILANILVLISEYLSAAANPKLFEQSLYFYGSVPSLILSQQGGGPVSSITHMFIHGGVTHLLSNMIALWAFGKRVEDMCGPWRFLGFYIISGLFADIVSTMARVGDQSPGIGASGAVYGVMAAYFILFPKGRIRSSPFPIFIIILDFFLRYFADDPIFDMFPLLILGLLILAVTRMFQKENNDILKYVFPITRAYWVVPYFIVFEVRNALQVLAFDVQSNVGHWAHIGGFIGGLFIFLFIRSDAFHRYRNELPL
jgi:membrane associated rhomboid family serine protease